MKEELITFFTAMIPIGELRVAIPLAITAFKFPIWKAFILGVLGNIIPNFFILALLGPVSNFLSKNSKFFHNFFKRLFEKTRAKHSEKFNRAGALFLILFIGIPLPGTGSWTGSLIAFLFGIPYLKALVLITIGVILAGIIVTLGTTGIVEVFKSLTLINFKKA